MHKTTTIYGFILEKLGGKRVATGKINFMEKFHNKLIWNEFFEIGALTPTVWGKLTVPCVNEPIEGFVVEESAILSYRRHFFA